MSGFSGFLQRASSVVQETAAQAFTQQPPPDPQLAKSKNKLEKLRGIIEMIKTSYVKYAGAMVELTTIGQNVANAMTSFYVHDRKTPSRKQSVAAFAKTQALLKQTCNDLFTHSFEGTSIREFDNWSAAVVIAKEQIDDAEKIRYDMFKAHNRHQSMIARQKKLESGGGMNLFGNTNKERHQLARGIPGAKRELEALKKQFTEHKKRVGETVQRFATERFGRLDKCFANFVDSQRRYFQIANAHVQELEISPMASQTGTKIAVNTSTRNTSSRRSSADKRAPSRPQRRPPKSSPPAASPKDSPRSGQSTILLDQSSSGSPSQQNTPELAPRRRSYGHDIFGLANMNASPPPGEPSPPATQQRQPRSSSSSINSASQSSVPRQDSKIDFQDMLFTSSNDTYTDLLGGAPSSPPSTSKPHMTRAATTPPRERSGNRTHRTSPADLLSFATASTAPTQTQPNTSDSLLDFGFSPQPKAPAHRPPSPPIRGSQTGRKRDSVGAKWFTEDPVPKPQKAPGPAARPKFNEKTTRRIEEECKKEVARVTKQKTDAAAAEAALLEAREAVPAAVEEWEFKNGQRLNLKQLITSMHKVLWDGTKWKPVPLTAVLSEKGLRKSYQKAMREVHPDRIANRYKNKPNYNTICATAERIFTAINEANKADEAQR